MGKFQPMAIQSQIQEQPQHNKGGQALFAIPKGCRTNGFRVSAGNYDVCGVVDRCPELHYLAADALSGIPPGCTRTSH